MVYELELVADKGARAILSGDNAVVTSLGGAMISLIEPNLRSATGVNPVTILSYFTNVLKQNIRHKYWWLTSFWIGDEGMKMSIFLTLPQ